MAASPAEPKRVVFLLDGLEANTAGGTERQVLHLAEVFHQRGWEPSICLLRGSMWQSEKTTSAHVHEAHIASFASFNGLTAAYRLLRWMRSQKFLILQTFFVEANLLGPVLGRMAHIPVIFGSRRNSNHWMTRRFAFFQRFANRFTTALIANSDAVKRQVIAKEGAHEGSVWVIHNGVDCQRFRPDPVLRQQVRSELGLSSDSILIGAIATLRPVKRLDDLLHALARIRESQPNVHVALIGDGPLRADLEKLAAELQISNSVHFLGAHDDVERYLPAFDIGVLCSEAEGFSNTLLEMLAAGLPIVATDVGGNREAMGSATGYLVTPRDVPALSEALTRLSNHSSERTQHGEAARTRVLELFSVEAVDEKLFEAYSRCLSQKQKAD